MSDDELWVTFGDLDTDAKTWASAAERAAAIRDALAGVDLPNDAFSMWGYGLAVGYRSIRTHLLANLGTGHEQYLGLQRVLTAAGMKYREAEEAAETRFTELAKQIEE